MKKALITGITGQDGSYLAEFLLEKGYEVSSALYSRMKSITWLHSPMYRFLLTYRSIPATWTRSACCGFWRQSAFSV